jgi:hypothetical protein
MTVRELQGTDVVKVTPRTVKAPPIPDIMKRARALALAKTRTVSANCSGGPSPFPAPPPGHAFLARGRSLAKLNEGITAGRRKPRPPRRSGPGTSP